MDFLDSIGLDKIMILAIIAFFWWQTHPAHKPVHVVAGHLSAWLHHSKKQVNLPDSPLT